MGHCRGGRVLGISFFPGDVNLYPICRQDFQGCLLSRGGEGVGVPTHVKGAVDALAGAILSHSLGNGQDVVFVKSAVGSRTPMPRGAKTNFL